MKVIKVLLVALTATFSIDAMAQSDSTSFKVGGNCGMCKNRIEGSVKGPAVFMANWNIRSKIMTVRFDSTQIHSEQLQQMVASVGHDTDQFKADKTVYDELPGCCLYDRVEVRINKKPKKKSRH